jgi:hypothetical protein
VGKPGDQKHVHELGLDKMDVSLVMKLMEQGYATRMIIESTDGKIEEFIHPALEMTRHITSFASFWYCTTSSYLQAFKGEGEQKQDFYSAASDMSFKY